MLYTKPKHLQAQQSPQTAGGRRDGTTLSITSRTNEKIKLAVKLGKSAGARADEGLFVIEGARLCGEAAACGVEIDYAFLTEKAAEKYPGAAEAVMSKARECFEVSAGAAQAVAGTAGPQGIVCVCRMPKPAESAHFIAPGRRCLALDNVQDPANLGAVIRTAEALGIDAVIAGGGCDVYNPKTLRSAMGSVFRMRVHQTGDLAGFLKQADSAGLNTVALVTDPAAENIRSVDTGAGFVCVVGNEGAGVSEQILQLCKTKATIPMRGKTESLNAAAAAAIAMWELSK